MNAKIHRKFIIILSVQETGFVSDKETRNNLQTVDPLLRTVQSCEAQ